MPKVKTRTVAYGLGRTTIQKHVPCTHGCSKLTWVTIGMPGHPCCDDCFKTHLLPGGYRDTISAMNAVQFDETTVVRDS